MHLGVLAAFVAGVVSFLSPCVFPLVPGYLSYLAGTTVRDAGAEAGARWRVTLHAAFFVLGFILIFVMLGAVASSIGVVLKEHQLALRHVSGVLIILFGVALTGLLPLPFLQRERRLHIEQGEPALLRSALIGLAFGAGWTPCIGPILGSIFMLAQESTTLTQGVFYLFVYGLGLGVPFLLAGLLIDRVGGVVRRINRYTRPIQLVGGVVLALTGVLILTGTLDQLARFSPIINL